MDATQGQVTPITDSPQLEYAPRPSVLRRRSTYWPIWFIVASVIVIIGLRMTRTLIDRWEVVGLQRACMNYVPPPGASVTPASPSVPTPWRRLYSEISGAALKSDGCLFLHARRRTDGLERLVAIDLIRDERPPKAVVRVIAPGSLRRRPHEVAAADVIPIGTGRNQPVFLGIPDPADATHFTIDYQSFDGRRTLDGYLRNDDTVVLELRPPEEPTSGPATPAPPPPAGPSR